MNKPELKTPTPQEQESLKELLQDYIDYVESDEYHFDRAPKYLGAIEDHLLEIYFGEKIWKYLDVRGNKREKENRE